MAPSRDGSQRAPADRQAITHGLQAIVSPVPARAQAVDIKAGGSGQGWGRRARSLGRAQVGVSESYCWAVLAPTVPKSSAGP